MEALIAIILAIFFWWKGGGGAGGGVIRPAGPRPYPSGGTFYPPGYKADQNREPAWQREI